MFWWKLKKNPNNLLHIYDLKVHSNFDNFEIKTFQSDWGYLIYLLYHITFVPKNKLNVGLLQLWWWGLRMWSLRPLCPLRSLSLLPAKCLCHFEETVLVGFITCRNPSLFIWRIRLWIHVVVLWLSIQSIFFKSISKEANYSKYSIAWNIVILTLRTCMIKYW